MTKVDLICCFFEQESRVAGYFESNFERFDPPCWITWNGSTDNGSQQAAFHFEPNILWMCSHYLNTSCCREFFWRFEIEFSASEKWKHEAGKVNWMWDEWKVWKLVSKLLEEFCPWKGLWQPQIVVTINLASVTPHNYKISKSC